MKTSIKGLLFLLDEEAIVLSTYKDAVGVLTIGAGHTAAAGGYRLVSGGKITLEQALAVFALDMFNNERLVLKAIRRPLTQNQFDALVSFEHNTGAISSGSVDDKLNAGDILGAMATLKSYKKAGGKTLTDLVNRRAKEVAMFEQGIYPDIKFLKVYNKYPGPMRHVPVNGLLLEALTKGAGPSAPITPPIAPKPLPAPSSRALGPLQTVLKWLSLIFKSPLVGSRQQNGVKPMLEGQKTNSLSLVTLAGVGGLAAGGGWQMVLTYAPVILTVLMPVLAMTLHAAIKRYGLQSQATSAEQVLAFAKAAGWGPLSVAAGAADDVLTKALAEDTTATK